MLSWFFFIIMLTAMFFLLKYKSVFTQNSRKMDYLEKNLDELEFYFSKVRRWNTKKDKFWLNCAEMSIRRALKVSDKGVRLIKNHEYSNLDYNVLCPHFNKEKDKGC